MLALHRIVRLGVGVFFAMSMAGCEQAGCPDKGPASSDATATLLKDLPVAVSSPYLEAAISDVLCRDIPLVRLAGPSMCPGHFDMRPRQISDLARCGLLMRFDFQQELDERLAVPEGKSRAIAVITVPGGLCVPDTYLSACRQVADQLVRAGFLTRAEADARLARLADRMASLCHEVQRQIRDNHLHDVSVLASGHQADFCRWLGLRMVAEISSAEGCRIHDVDEALKAGQAAGVELVVANAPEGRRSADALAERLRARVVVFANFPNPVQKLTFDDLVRQNLTALLQARHSHEARP